MSITIELPPDLDERVRVIPDLDKRIVQFLRTQTDLEEWRNRKYSPEARAAAGRALAEADRMRAAGMTREEAFEQLRSAHDEVSSTCNRWPRARFSTRM